MKNKMKIKPAVIGGESTGNCQNVQCLFMENIAL